MYNPLVLLPLFGAFALASPLKANSKELTDSPAVLLARDPNWIPGLPSIPGQSSPPKWAQNADDTCKVKTIYGPYTLKVPTLGFGQGEEYYAEKISDILCITGHGPNDDPLGSNRKPGVELDYIVTKHITLSFSTSIWYHTIPGGYQPTNCATTVTVTKGLPDFPTEMPLLPKPIPHMGQMGVPAMPAPTHKATYYEA
ncbi:uncharacterized protein RAG0_08563 [Rhynchosporium agropyri]|uniref:Uncharacterized protein n=1 Tax=Rhynchosporium agropyri TaxID=914238 RepID=A0A1E1KRD0_9HELO|nr:uncharacterized protein RAG0_08563 [Rhynchosporium agropyri]